MAQSRKRPAWWGFPFTPVRRVGSGSEEGRSVRGQSRACAHRHRSRQGEGALAKMVPPFKMFAGGPLGSGQQWMPWIHIEDKVGLICFLIENDAARGAFNGSAPNPVTMEVFAKALGDVLNRPSWVSVPPSALALMLGEMSEMLLHGQRAVPEAALVLTTIEARHPRQSMNALDHDEPDSDQESF
jgi:uncharacterized protein (TIGR01777 family)